MSTKLPIFCRVGQNALLNTVPGDTHCNEMGDFHNMMIFTTVQLMTITKMSSVIYSAMATLMSLLHQKPFVCDKAKKSVNHAYYRGLKSVTLDYYLRLQFIILMNDTWRVKRCIIIVIRIIIIILKSVFAHTWLCQCRCILHPRTTMAWWHVAYCSCLKIK